MSDVLVLCYHAVSPRWPADLSVTPEAFERQLQLLVDRGYRGATFHEAVTSPPTSRTVAVTFDDAYLSVLELAKPIMDRLGLVGTVFVPTDYPERDEPDGVARHRPVAGRRARGGAAPDELGADARPRGRRLGDRLAHLLPSRTSPSSTSTRSTAR